MQVPHKPSNWVLTVIYWKKQANITIFLKTQKCKGSLFYGASKVGKIPLSPCLRVVHSKVFNMHESIFEYFGRSFLLFCFPLVEINTNGNSSVLALVHYYIAPEQISYSVSLSLNWSLALFCLSKKPLELQHA